jgi:hypothetical protein
LDTTTQVLIRIARAAAAAAIPLLLVAPACSSSSTPHPPETGGCTATPTMPCAAQIGTGGGSSPPADAGEATDTGSTVPGEGSCAGASAIYNSSQSCAACVATNCCGNGSCPSDPSCTQIATCVVSSCLPNDPSCLPTCEAASATGTITEYVAFEQCVGASCPGCPNGATNDL